ncbi:hypothetical protein ES705_18024 [subsurface metagenome]
MTVAETIKSLSDLREDGSKDITLRQFEAIGVAICVLASLEPAELCLVDTLLAYQDAPSN